MATDKVPTADGQAVFAALPIDFRVVIEHYHERTQSRQPLKISDFTCCNCAIVKTCAYAYDLYNLDDDCLAEK